MTFESPATIKYIEYNVADKEASLIGYSLCLVSDGRGVKHGNVLDSDTLTDQSLASGKELNDLVPRFQENQTNQTNLNMKRLLTFLD